MGRPKRRATDPPGVIGHRRRLLPALLGAAVVLVCVVVEAQLFRSYTDTERTTREFARTTDATTAVANVQREAMVMVLLAERLEDGDSLAPLRLRRQLLERQIEVFESAAAATSFRRSQRLALRVRPFDAVLERLDHRGRARGVEAAKSSLRATLDRFTRRVKHMFDNEEHDLYEALGQTMDERRERQRLLLVLGAIALLIAIFAAYVSRRVVRADFARAYEALSNEVKERTALQDELSHRALHDPLTGLGNRLKFRELLRELLVEKRPTGKAAVLYLDLDDFKVVNDSLGHDAGDALLCAAADRLRGVVRSDDQLARLGGDEFAAIVMGLDDDNGVARVAERLVGAFAEPFAIAGHSFDIGVSLGVRVLDGTVDSAEQAIHQADLAMYAAKNDGKGAARHFSSAMTTQAEARAEVEQQLRGAEARGEIEVHFQPVVTLDGAVPVGFEALVRWQHPERGLLSPADFLRVAEDSGLIVPIGWHVLVEACRAAADWPAIGGLPPWVSVNLSPRQLREPDVLDQVLSALETTGLAPERLMIEISEMAMIKDCRAVAPQLAKLQAAGVRIALDDFGTGHASLGYLRFLAIDVLKIDKSFTDHLPSANQGSRLAEALVRLGGQLRLQTIAEGVEDGEQAAALREMGCELAQGYHFSRPVPGHEVPVLIERGAATIGARSAL